MYQLHQYTRLTMAKKKNRSANVARKREKRNRNRKTKNKQLASEKQRRSPYGKMDEERLHTCLLRSADLLEEPEFEKVHFDFDLMFVEVAKFLKDREMMENFESSVRTDNDGLDLGEDSLLSDQNDISDSSEDSDEAFEKFRLEAFPRLITPKFMRTLLYALTKCENRFKRTGDHDQADVTFVARSFFEVVPAELYGLHPLIEGIGMQTLRLFCDQPEYFDVPDPNATDILSEVLETENAEFQEGKLSSMLSEVITEEHAYSEVETPQVAEPPALMLENEPLSDVSLPLPSPDTLPAKALYKNFDGLAIREVLKNWEGHTLGKETATQLDYFNHDQELYVTVTENRVQLHAHSEAELTVAMEELEAQCQSALMYLAKTYEEGGKTDGTE